MRYVLVIHAYTDLAYSYSGLTALLDALWLLRDCPHALSIRPEVS